MKKKMNEDDEKDILYRYLYLDINRTEDVFFFS